MKNRIKAVMAKAFEVPEDQITEQSNQDTIETWDSIHHMHLVVFLEREFDITIPDEMVGKMVSFKLIETAINGCQA